nr:Gag-Pol polyprotein [Tanacetum cinerariifolium]
MFGKDYIASILKYGDLVQGNITIKRVYYVKGLNHNLFFVGQLCDADLDVAFRKSTCYFHDLKGIDLLTSSRGIDLYSITLQDTSTPNPIYLMAKASSSQACYCIGIDLLISSRGTDLYSITLQDTSTPNPIYLMAKASSSQAWLLHRRLSHLNFDTINLLLKYDIVTGLPKLNFVKDHLCSSCVPLCQVLHCLLILLQLVEIVLFIVDYGCSKHMTGNLKLLIKFVEKFFGTVKFGNDQIAPILGYRDLVQGAVTIKRVYYVEGLSHNLFSVGQFCDADLEVAFRKSTCYIRDLKGNDLLIGLKMKHLKFLLISSGLSKEDFMLKGLHAQVRIVRTDKGTEFLNKGLHAYFASEGIFHQTSVARTPEQNDVVERRNRTLVEAARTMLNAAKVPLFFWAEAITITYFTQNLSLVVLKSSVVSTADAPNQCQQQHTTPLNNQATPDPTFENDEFINIFCTPVQDRGETSSQHVDSSNMHTFYQHHPFKHRWTKDHPLEQVIGNPSQSVRTRRQLESDGEMCMFAFTVSRTKPKNIKEAMADSAWIESIQKELHQFDRLDVWELVDRPLYKNVINMKWLWKNKHDEENTVIRNKSRLVAKGYAQKE